MCVTSLLLAPVSPVVLSAQGNESTLESHLPSRKEGARGPGTSA